MWRDIEFRRGETQNKKAIHTEERSLSPLLWLLLLAPPLKLKAARGWRRWGMRLVRRNSQGDEELIMKSAVKVLSFGEDLGEAKQSG